MVEMGIILIFIVMNSLFGQILFFQAKYTVTGFI